MKVGKLWFNTYFERFNNTLRLTSPFHALLYFLPLILCLPFLLTNETEAVRSYLNRILFLQREAEYRRHIKVQNLFSVWVKLLLLQLFARSLALRGAEAAICCSEPPKPVFHILHKERIACDCFVSVHTFCLCFPCRLSPYALFLLLSAKLNCKREACCLFVPLCNWYNSSRPYLFVMDCVRWALAETATHKTAGSRWVLSLVCKEKETIITGDEQT